MYYMITPKVLDMCSSEPNSTKEASLPLGSSAGVGSPSWVQSWWETRTLASLPVEGHLGAPLMPAPALHSDTQWSTRPLTSTEITAMLRSLLGVFEDTRLTSHSLKSRREPRASEDFGQAHQCSGCCRQHLLP